MRITIIVLTGITDDSLKPISTTKAVDLPTVKRQAK